jgi:hypothetical protein
VLELHDDAHQLHLARIAERHELRGRIRAAGDAGDHEEVARLVRRAHDLELECFAFRYTEVRHARAQHGRGGGSNPALAEVEGKLTELLARAGEPLPRDMWTHRG